jgi:hypothetical protein
LPGAVLLLAMLLMACAHGSAQAKDGPPAHRREVRVRTRAGHVLAGTLTMPSGTARGMVAVYVSGAGPQARDYSTIVDVDNHAFASIEHALLVEGIGGFRYDEVGMGASTGAYRPYATTTTLADDLVDVLRVLESGAVVDARDVVLIGHSEGAHIAALATARAERVRGLVLLAAPAVPGNHVMRDQWRTFAAIRKEPSDVQQFIHRERIRSEPWYREFLVLDPAAAYTRVPVPVLLLQGERDHSVPSWHADSVAALLHAGGNRNVTMVRLPELGHAFVPEPDPWAPIDGEVITRVTRWTSRLLRPGSRDR